MLRICDHPDCTTLTLGTFCVTHEPPAALERFPRGRPYARRERRPPAALAVQVEDDERGEVHAVSFGGGTPS
jgi:hypothetical protein